MLESYELKNKILLGYYREDKLIGVLGYETDKCSSTILHLSVSSEYQNTGIGSALLKHIQQKYLSIKVETDEQSKEFYMKCGFNCIAKKNSRWPSRYECAF